MNTHVENLARSLVRRSPLLMSLSFRARGIRPLDSLAELDAFFDECMRGSQEVTAEALERMTKAYLKVPKAIKIPGDPFSPEYRKAQHDLYALIAGRPYEFQNEATGFDFEAVKNDFFPYNTGSGAFVGEQLLKQGFAIRNVHLPRGSRIVEFGAGWGNLTVQLALMGYRMTAVELNPPSIALMAHRAGLHGKTISFAQQDMLEFAETTRETFDAALFLASFHHSLDHQKLAENLGRILSPRGEIYFADEPIAPVGSPVMPYPWGLRLEAASLYYVRRHGWMELGFQAGYFKELLARTGWGHRIVPSEIRGVPDLWIATRKTA
ncbi:MAG: class I SAM-dependent methyltransferase [Fibrobacteres bacterium]|nr:class I SAM-dependent methyltransferase [Fibrobacterota bacterium]